jgi:hypothetical protein
LKTRKIHSLIELVGRFANCTLVQLKATATEMEEPETAPGLKLGVTFWGQLSSIRKVMQDVAVAVKVST